MMAWDNGTPEIEVKTAHCEEMLGIKSEIDHDGDAATCSVAFTNQHPFNVHVPFDGVALLLQEFRNVASVMMARQRLKLDRGASKVIELAEMARPPTDIDVMVNPLTADRILMVYFADSPPVALRLAPDIITATRAKIERAARLAAH